MKRGLKLLIKWTFDNNTLRTIEAKQEKVRSIVLYCQRIKATDEDIWKTLNDIGCTSFAQFFDILKHKVDTRKKFNKTK